MHDTITSRPDPSERLDRLERRLRRAGAGGAIAVAALVGMAFAPRWQEEVRAESFVLVDGQGRTRGSWHVTEAGHASLALIEDGVEKPAVELFLTGDEAFLTMRDRKGRNRIGLSVDREGNPHAVLLDERMLPRLHAAVGASGHANLVFIDKDGEMPAGIGVMPDGRAWSRPGHDEAWPERKR